MLFTLDPDENLNLRTKDPTLKQREVLLFIDQFNKKYKYGPTYGEMSKQFNLSESTMKQRVYSLSKRNLVSWTFCKSRTLHLTEGGFDEIKKGS